MALSIGKTKYSKGGNIRFAKYECNQIAMFIVDPETGEVQAKATVAIPEAPLLGNHVWIKDWSENEGMFNALIDANIITNTFEHYPCGHVFARQGRLTGKAIKELLGQAGIG